MVLFQKCCNFHFLIQHTSSNNKSTIRAKQLAPSSKKSLTYSRLNNIHIKLNLCVRHLQTGCSSFGFTEIWYTVRCGRKHPSISILEIPYCLEMVKVRAELAVSFLWIFFGSVHVFHNTVTDLFPVLFSAYQIFHFFCKTILNQNLVVTHLNILASDCVSLHYLLTQGHLAMCWLLYETQEFELLTEATWSMLCIKSKGKSITYRL